MIQIEDIIKILQEKNPATIPNVMKSYQMAEYAHRGVMRESGDPYITHPLHVAKNLLDMEIYDDILSRLVVYETEPKGIRKKLREKKAYVKVPVVHRAE